MDRWLHKDVLVPARQADVWRAWTTQEGVQTFFAPTARLELRFMGPYEMLFDLDAPVGSQGSEGCRILCFVPERVLGFEWNAPPHLTEARQTHTFVVVRLEPEGEDTRVGLDHGGFGEGGEWDAVVHYFDRAWEIVLGRLAWSFSAGPIDWSDPGTPG